MMRFLKWTLVGILTIGAIVLTILAIVSKQFNFTTKVFLGIGAFVSGFLAVLLWTVWQPDIE